MSAATPGHASRGAVMFCHDSKPDQQWPAIRFGKLWNGFLTPVVTSCGRDCAARSRRAGHARFFRNHCGREFHRHSLAEAWPFTAGRKPILLCADGGAGRRLVGSVLLFDVLLDNRQRCAASRGGEVGR